MNKPEKKTNFFFTKVKESQEWLKWLRYTQAKQPQALREYLSDHLH